MNAWCWPSSILLLFQLTACTRDPHGTARDHGLCLSADWPPVAVDDTIIVRPGHLDDNSSNCLHEQPATFSWQVEDSTVLEPLDLGRFRAVRPGSSTIRITRDSETTERGFLVLPPMDSIRLVPRDTLLAIDDSIAFTATGYTRDGRELPTLGFHFRDHGDSVMTVRRRRDGSRFIVWGQHSGTAYVTASMRGLADTVGLRVYADSSDRIPARSAP
jgi:hypothetical protein